MSRRVRRALAGLAVAIAALALGACDGGGDPEPPRELSEADSSALIQAREGLDRALRREAKLRASPRAARKIRGKVQEIASEGVFEAKQLDEFGLAALGRLKLVAPNLVISDADGVPESIDKEATRAFLRFAERDPSRALLPVAERHVTTIERTVERSEPGRGTRIEQGGDAAASSSAPPRVGRYLETTEAAIQTTWPELSGRLHVLREGL